MQRRKFSNTIALWAEQLGEDLLDIDQFKVSDSKSFDFAQLPTEYDSGLDKGDLKDLRADLWQQVREYQEILYAESKQSLLIVFQAMDAAGKDSSIQKLTQNLNVQGCHVTSFKAPSKKEKSHDFLWRVHQACPAAGEIGIFNRSHYEDVLIVKVHQWASEEKIVKRYQHINNFESLLHDRGTRVLKFMLNISPEYQLERFRQRLRHPEKHWKFNPGDLEERKLWQQYMAAFADVFRQCSPEKAPWYIVPAENRRFRDCMVAATILAKLKEMAPEFPAPEYDIHAFDPSKLS